MRRGMKKLCSIKVRRYVASLIDLNEYVASLPGATLAGKKFVTEFNEIILSIMPNSWS